MNRDEATLAGLVSFLSAAASVRDKVGIQKAYEPAKKLAGQTRVGDDCAAIRHGEEWLLFSAEGMLPSFVAEDPWFAGYSAVMVNLSAVAAMGDVRWPWSTSSGPQALIGPGQSGTE